MNVQNVTFHFLTQCRYAELFCSVGEFAQWQWSTYNSTNLVKSILFFLANPSARPERPVVEVSVYATRVRPILQYGAVCCDPYREGKIHDLDKVQKEAVKFTLYTNESIWETLSHRRKMSRVFSLFKAYYGEESWKAIGVRLPGPNTLIMVNL
jgi:hypothetical protein